LRLLERDAELRELAGELARAREGTGTLIVIDGAAGLGKSSLMRCAVERARGEGMSLLGARGSVAERDFSFGVVLQLFGTWYAAAGAAEREEALSGAASLALPLLEGRHADASATEAGANGLLHGLFWLTASLASRAPLLIAIDDLHWCDPASLRFVQYLLHRLEELPIAILASRRPAEPDTSAVVAEVAAHPLARSLPLAPLSRGAISQLLEERLDARAGPRFAEAAEEGTGGNPFLLDAVIRGLGERGIEPSDENAGRIAELRPASVREGLLSRVRHLGPEAGALASAATLFGPEAPLSRVAAIAELDLDSAAAAADALTAAGVLSSAAPISFAHPLHRAFLYEEMAVAQRGRAHVRAARLLREEGAPVEEVAAQLLAASEVGESWAGAVLREAAATALAAGNSESAVNYLTRAVSEPLGSQERAEALLDLARAEAMTGRPDTRRHIDRALSLFQDPGGKARAYQALGGVLYTGGDLKGAAEAFGRAIELIDDDDPLARDLHAGFYAEASLEPELAGRALDHIAPLVNRPPGGETPAERAALAALAAHRSFSGSGAAGAVELAWRAWGDGALLAAEGPDGWAWSLVTAALTWSDELEGSLEICGGVIEEARRRGSLMAYATASFCAQGPSYFMGRLGEARAHGEAALEARRAGWRTYAGALAAIQARILVDQDEPHAAEEVLGLVEEDDPSQSADRAAAIAARAHLRLVQGRPEEALSDALAAGEMLARIKGVCPPLAPWRAEAALAANQLGDHARALRLSDQALDVARRIGAPGNVARALLTRAHLVRPERGVELLRQALDVAGGSQARMAQLRCRAELGTALRRAGQRTEARRLLAEAREQAHRCGARLIERRMDEELRVAGARPRRLRFSGPDALTASERRVAQMAAEGRSNRDIAQSLFVTTRTVEQHLYKTYKKLGIDSRRALAGALADE
jgi:DNA-binding CsgD family transcriptional regulator